MNINKKLIFIRQLITNAGLSNVKYLLFQESRAYLLILKTFLGENNSIGKKPILDLSILGWQILDTRTEDDTRKNSEGTKQISSLYYYILFLIIHYKNRM